MFKKEIEELNKAIKHLENDILPSKCNGNISCYNEHTQLYKWLKELKSYKEIRTKNNEDIFEEYAEKWWYNEYSPHTYTNSKEVWKNGAEFGYNKANEWHYVKDGDYPKDNKPVLCILGDIGPENCEVGYYNDVGSGEPWHFETYHLPDDDGDNAWGVYAWKEIVLPELPKESE